MVKLNDDEVSEMASLCFECIGYVSREKCFCNNWHVAGMVGPCLVCRARTLLAERGLDADEIVARFNARGEQ